MGLILDLFKVHQLWLALILLIIALFSTIWIIKGNIIFCPWKWSLSRHTTVEIREIEVSDELSQFILGKPKVKGRTLPIKSHIVKRKIKK